MSEILISRDKIRIILEDFYKKVLVDEDLGPSFQVISPHFNEHVEQISDFWDLTLNSKKLMENPDNSEFQLVDIHVALHVDKEQLEKWMSLFQESLYSVSKPEDKKAIDKWWSISKGLEKFFELKIL